MGYVVEREGRWYAVGYEGLQPTTGRDAIQPTDSTKPKVPQCLLETRRDSEFAETKPLTEVILRT